MFNTLAAASFNLVGDYTKNVLADGSLPKVAIHAMVGGLLAEATGGDFKTGALAAAASEALVGHLDTLVKGNDTLLTMSSQIVGVLAAAAQSDTDAAKLETGSWVAKNATQYNYLSHRRYCIQDATRKFQELSLQQDIDAIVSCQADPSSCAASSKEVANTMANLNAIRDIADYASPDAREAVQSLINGNYEFQEMLATATTEHSVGAMVESLKSKWALSDAQAQDIAHNLKIALAVGVGTAAGVVAYRRAVAGGAKGILTPKDFPEVAGKVSQKQLRHIAGRPELEARGSGGFLNSVDDAQKVLDAYRIGQVKILGKNAQGFPVVKFEGVTGTNVNTGVGITGQPTNVFIIKGTKSPSIVPANPNWTQK
ncbi:Possible hemagglutinin [Pseudomonas sp. NFPP04]|nr:Possible hemagglutinin [Pseudomonas sp. NFPP04]